MKKTLLIIGILLSFVGCTTIKPQNKIEYHLIRGMNYSKVGDYPSAIKEYNEYYRVDRKNSILLGEMAMAYGQLGDYSMAERYYLENLKVAPNDNITLLNLSTLYYKTKNFEKSKRYLKKIPENTSNYRVFLLKGYLYYEEKDYEKTYFNLNKVFEIGGLGQDIISQELIERYVDVLENTSRWYEIYPFIIKAYNLKKYDKNIVLTSSRLLAEKFDDYETSMKFLKEYTANERSDEIILELAKLNFEIENFTQSKLYLQLLDEGYKYNLEVLSLKERLAIRENKFDEAKQYKELIMKMRGF